MRWKSCGGGIYRDSTTAHYYERPWVDGKRTWRKLDGHNLKLARECMAVRRTDAARSKMGLAEDPYAPAQITTVGAILDKWVEVGCPNQRGHPKGVRQLDLDIGRVRFLREFFGNRNPATLHPVTDSEDYCKSRTKNTGRGGRACELDLRSLSTALHWASRHQILKTNPMASGRPWLAKAAVHCREHAPLDSAELHSIAALLFEDRKSEVLGWQMLMEAFTGCRTSEVLAMRWDAKPQEPGWTDGQYLWLARRKGGTNPFAVIHPGLKKMLSALRLWGNKRRDPAFPSSSPRWFFPSPIWRDRPVIVTALAHALARLETAIGHKVTSHGMRAFYVTARRSQGVSDAQIAAEIGDKTGAAIIASTYGAVPPNWSGKAAINWIPKSGAAWGK